MESAPNYVAVSGRGREKEIAAFRACWGEGDGEVQFAAHCRELFNAWNRRDFGGRLGPVQIRVGDGNQTRSEVGYGFYGRYLRARGRGCRSAGAAPPGRSAVIELDYHVAIRPRKLRLVLLHEMLHHYEHETVRDPERAWEPLEQPIDRPPYLGAALELAFLLTGDRDVRRWLTIELGFPWGPEDDGRTRFYLRGHSHRFVVAAYNLARRHRRVNRWYYV
jgi:hypothetical protein